MLALLDIFQSNCLDEISGILVHRIMLFALFVSSLSRYGFRLIPVDYCFPYQCMVRLICFSNVSSVLFCSQTADLDMQVLNEQQFLGSFYGIVGKINFFNGKHLM